MSRGNEIMQFFTCSHLPDDLAEVKFRLCDVANYMDVNLVNCAEKSAGLRKLLEASDCFVRAAILSREDDAD